MRLFAAAMLPILIIGPAIAQEQGDWTSSFSRIKGGAVFDYKEGLDGTLVSEEYLLTHVVCTDGSKTVRVMLPLGLDDDATSFTMDGEPSTLKQRGSGYRVDFKLGSKRIVKALELKPVNDGKSHYKKQFMFSLDYGDPLWKAMTSGLPGDAMMLIGTGGTPVGLPDDPKLRQALKSCGLAK